MVQTGVSFWNLSEKEFEMCLEGAAEHWNNLTVVSPARNATEMCVTRQQWHSKRVLDKGDLGIPPGPFQYDLTEVLCSCT